MVLLNSIERVDKAANTVLICINSEIYSKMILLATLSFGVEENVLLRLRVVLRLDFLRRRPVKGFLMMNQ